MGDKINIWIIDSGDEFAREAFKNWESRKASSSNTDRLTTSNGSAAVAPDTFTFTKPKSTL